MASWATVVASGQSKGKGLEADLISEDECVEARRLVIGDSLCISEDAGLDCLARWKYGLVGRFIRGTQPLAVIRAALRFYWEKLRSFELLQASEKAWLILFESEDDLQWALHGGPWAICGSVLFLERWTEGFDFSSQVKTLVPVWVLFPDLPNCFKNRSVVIALASRAGKPIRLDSASLVEGNSSAPKVKVMCDLADPVIEGTFIEVNGFRVWQRYKYGGFVRPCHKCGIIGHSQSVCPQEVVISQRGRSKSRRKRFTSRSRDPLAGQQRGKDSVIEGDLEEGLEVGDAGRLIIQLSGSEEAEITVENEVETSNVLGGAAALAGSHVKLRVVQREDDISLLGSQARKETSGGSPGGSDSEEDLAGAQATVPGPGIGAGAGGKSREGKTPHSTSRTSRRGRDQSEETSAADRFRAAGAKEGVRVKANKSHKATKVAFEA